MACELKLLLYREGRDGEMLDCSGVDTLGKEKTKPNCS